MNHMSDNITYINTRHTWDSLVTGKGLKPGTVLDANTHNIYTSTALYFFNNWNSECVS